MVKLCIFDMDGLLLDSERAMWTPSQRQACAEQGYVLTHEIHAQYMGMSFSDAKNILKSYFKDLDFEKLINRTLELNNDYIEKGLPLKKGALELLTYCKNNNIKTCIGTSTLRQATLKTLKVIDMLKMFDEVVCGDDIKHGKPNPDIYLKCHSLFNVDKSETLVFEDSQSGGIAAIKAGLRLCLVPDLAFIAEDTKAKAYKVLSSLDEAIDIIKEENETASRI